MYFSRVSGQKWKFWRQALFGTLMVSFVLPRFLHYNFGENFVRQAVASVQLQSCPTLCNPMDCNMSGSSVHHQLLQLAQTHVHRVGDAIQPSHPLLFPSSCLQSFPALGSFLMSQLFTSGGQRIGASASASVFPMHIQGWFPLGLTSLISLQFKDSQESSPTPLFKSINSSALSFLYSSALTCVHDYWKSHSFD